MNKDLIISKSEDIIYLVLAIIAILFIVVETVDLVYIFYKEVSLFSLASERPLGLSGVPIFFNILITLEILETFKNHHNNILSRVKIILLVGLTAIVRKLISLDVTHSEYLLLIGLSVLILSLCAGYFFLSRKRV